jgi:hypothetical protein
MEDGHEEDMRIHNNTQDLEWFRLSEHTLCPLFLYCSCKILEYRVDDVRV